MPSRTTPTRIRLRKARRADRLLDDAGLTSKDHRSPLMEVQDVSMAASTITASDQRGGRVRGLGRSRHELDGVRSRPEHNDRKGCDLRAQGLDGYDQQ